MEADVDRLELLLAKLTEVEPKLDGLMSALEKMVKDEVDRRMKERDDGAS